MMDYKKTASQIVENIGGKNNIVHMEHCSTRLRFTLKDESKANVSKLEKISGVMGVRQTAQCQVIIGNEVIEVYEEVVKITGNIEAATDGISSKNKKKIMELFS